MNAFLRHKTETGLKKMAASISHQLRPRPEIGYLIVFIQKHSPSQRSQKSRLLEDFKLNPENTNFT